MLKKGLFILFLATSVALNLYSKDRIVDRSSSTPKWIGTVVKDCFSTSAIGQTMDQAQQKCMDNVRQHIVTSIAANVSSYDTYKSLQVTQNDLINVFEEFSSNVNTQGAQLPFLTGISISNAEEIYWEKHYVKDEERYYYVYHILYPFPDSERDKYIQEFLILDKEQYDKYLRLKEEVDTFKQVEFISEAISEISFLKDYFFDSKRKKELSQLQYRYSKLYDQIVLQPLEESLGKVTYHLMLNGRVVTISKLPKIKTPSAATELSVVANDDDTYTLTYNYEYCMEEDDNKIDLSYYVGGRSIKRTIFFHVKDK